MSDRGQEASVSSHGGGIQARSKQACDGTRGNEPTARRGEKVVGVGQREPAEADEDQWLATDPIGKRTRGWRQQHVRKREHHCHEA